MRGLSQASPLLSRQTQVKSKIPYMILNGPVNTQMTSQVDFFLNKKMPQKPEKLAVIINSYSGCFSQAHIIINKLQQRVKKDNIQLLTFTQTVAVNSGFLLLMSGHKAFAERSAVLGGLRNGQNKVINKKLSEYIQTVAYTNDLSFQSEGATDEEYNPKKAADMKAIFEGFTLQAAQKIAKYRGQRLKNSKMLLEWMKGEEAKENGIIDDVGRLHEIAPKLVENPQLNHMNKSNWDHFIDALKNIKKQQ